MDQPTKKNIVYQQIITAMDKQDTEKTLFSISGTITLDGIEKSQHDSEMLMLTEALNKCYGQHSNNYEKCAEESKRYLDYTKKTNDSFWSSEEYQYVGVTLKDTIHATHSDEQGAFRIENIPAGKYTLIASQVGFDTYRQDITIDRNLNNIKINLLLKKLDDDDEWLDLHPIGTEDKRWTYFILLAIIGVVCYGGYKYFKKS